MARAEIVGPAVPGVVETELDDDVALFHPRTGQVVILNATAADVWRLSDGEHTLEALVAVLARAYAVEGSSIRDEVAAAVSDLGRHGFLAPMAE